MWSWIWGDKRKCIFDRSDDWICKGCRGKVFGNRDRCVRCNLDKYGNKDIRYNCGDWICKGCGCKIFGKKKKCFKCNLDRNGNVVPSKKKPITNKSKNIHNDKCVVCWEQDKNTLILHTNNKDAHQCCCYVCANRIFKTTKKCPICNQTIKEIIRIYN